MVAIVVHWDSWQWHSWDCSVRLSYISSSTLSLVGIILLHQLQLLSTRANRQGVDISYNVCVFCVCFFVCMLRIFLPSIKLVTSNFARQFIGVWGRECHNLGNFAPQGAQNWTNLPACYAATTFTACTTITLWLSNTWQRAVCGHRIGMCGYTVVSEDWHTCL